MYDRHRIRLDALVAVIALAVVPLIYLVDHPITVALTSTGTRPPAWVLALAIVNDTMAVASRGVLIQSLRARTQALGSATLGQLSPLALTCCQRNAVLAGGPGHCFGVAPNSWRTPRHSGRLKVLGGFAGRARLYLRKPLELRSDRDIGSHHRKTHLISLIRRRSLIPCDASIAPARE